MSPWLVLALLGGQAAATPPPPPGLLFGFYRMAAFRHRARELRCASGELDGQLETIRTRLIRRYGKKAFAFPKIPSGGPGDCYVAVSVYRVNLADFRREADAALAAPPPGGAMPAETR